MGSTTIDQIKRELKLFYTREKRGWEEVMLNFIKRNSKHLFLYKKLPREKGKGSSPAQLEGLDVWVDEWSELIYPEDEDCRIDPDTIFQSFKREEKPEVEANLYA